MRLAIIGYGPGGVSAAVAAKTFDRSAEVVIFTRETLPAHRKPGASLALEYPFTSELSISDWSFEALSSKGIEVISNATVLDVDPSSKKLRYEKDGSIFEQSYDRLLLATGGVPAIPNIKGVNLEGVFTIQDMSDTSRIGERLEKMHRIFVVGAGFSGLEVAERLMKLGKEVHLVVRSRLMRRLLEPPMSEELMQRVPRRIIIHSGVSPTEIIGDNHVQGIKLNNDILDADAVLIMTGVKPDTHLASAIGLKTGELGGVKVDSTMRTSVPDIYSVGDCIEMLDRLTGKPVLMPIGSVAARAGRQAGVAAVGGKKLYDDVTIRFQYDRIFDTDIVCVGHSSVIAKSLGYDVKVQYHEDPSEHTKVAIVTNGDGVVVGGQVIAPRMGARIGYQIHKRVEMRAKLKEHPLLEPLHKRLKDHFEETVGPIR